MLQFTTIIRLISVALVALGLSSTAVASSTAVEVRVTDTALVAGSQTSFISIRLDNYVDTVAGIALWLKSERPDLLTFNFSGPGFDSAGTRISGWEYVAVGDSLNNGVIWQFAAAADFYADAVHPAPIPPQSNGLIVRVPVSIPPNLDTTQIHEAPISFVNRQEFSTPGGRLIGVVTTMTIDTSYFACRNWLGDSCTLWIEVNPNIEPYDSVFVDSSLSGYVDTMVVVAFDGSIIILPTRRCDFNSDTELDLSDLICLVGHLFLGQSDPVCTNFNLCDSDSSGAADLSDLIALVNYLFLGGPPPI